MDELTPAMELAFDYARQLRAIDKDHELLKYFAEGRNPQLDEEFEQRFWNKPFPKESKPGHLVNATIWANFAAALKQAADGGPFLADFLTRELRDYVALDGKAINHSNSPLMIDGEEEFALNISQPLPQSLNQTVAKFYQQQGFQIKFYAGGVHVKKGTTTVKYVVITGAHSDRVLISVKLVS